MQKAYVRVNWVNFPSEDTALNASNLNRMDSAIDEIDNRVITLDLTKLSVAEADNLVESWDINTETGVITITKKDGTIQTKQTAIGKIAINSRYDRATQSIILTHEDGTTESISLSDFIQDNEFADTPTISMSATGGIVTANVRENSIGDSHLRRNYLADILVAEANAYASQSAADASATLSHSWAVGNTGGSREGEDTNNSMYFANVARGQAELATNAMNTAQDLVDIATAKVAGIHVHVNFEDGNLYYEEESGIGLRIEPTDGNLYYEVLTA